MPRPPKDPAELVGKNAKHNDPRYLVTSKAQRRNQNIAIPEAPRRWHPTARSWFNSLKLSGQSALYEASDWATAIAAAEAYDRFLRTDNASILAHFVKLSERLGVCESDRKRARIELVDGQVRDEDRERADAQIVDLTSRLKGNQ